MKMDKGKIDRLKDFKYVKKEEEGREEGREEGDVKNPLVNEITEPLESKDLEQLEQPILTEDEINIVARNILRRSFIIEPCLELPSHDRITLNAKMISAKSLRHLIEVFDLYSLRANPESLTLFFKEGTLLRCSKFLLNKTEEVED